MTEYANGLLRAAEIVLAKYTELSKRGYPPPSLLMELHEAIRAEASQPDSASIPDGVNEAFNRLLENGAALGQASAEDAILVSRYRRQMLASQPDSVVADALHPIVAGAIYDFAGFLTTRDAVIPVGSSANASPMVELVKQWAEMRGLQLHDAAVQSWQEHIRAAKETTTHYCEGMAEYQDAKEPTK